MLDINVVREKPEEVRKNLAKRQDEEVLKRFDDLVKTDKEWRSLKQEADDLRAKRNSISKEVEALMKLRKDKEAKAKIEEAKKIPDKIKQIEVKVKEIEEKRLDFLMRIPNTLHESVPFGKGSEDNVIVKEWGKITKPKFEIQHHGQLAVKLGVADFERAVKIAGEGFYFLKGDLALLNDALINFAVNYLAKKKYVYIRPPFMIRKKQLEGAVDLSEFESVIYKIENEDHYLIGTAEHAINAMHSDEIIDAEELPLRYFGFSTNFRKEIGKHGIDERGLFRLHQFDKVEQFIFCRPEESWKMHEELLKNAEEIVKALEIPYRIVNICTGDIGIVAAKKYDIECWSPREQKYFETHSLSNCTSYQAVRSNIKFKLSQGVKEYVHTLNATAIATQRALRAILENHQTSDRTVKIPKALQPFMNGLKEIMPEKARKKK